MGAQQKGGAYLQKHIRRGALIGKRSLNRIITDSTFFIFMLFSQSASAFSKTTSFDLNIFHFPPFKDHSLIQSKLFNGAGT